ncbi:hypothetical protein SMD44_08025 [Streptomyces alboflavus]|uniref:Uncharacterized protein n=1 Tax=Streptomyces alboflavus TaxID=67267 RepID=A0A1Z1WQ29_9ACTN|nr:hypothetical protein SMD44_08025 [Streptomyces alboflavus]
MTARVSGEARTLRLTACRAAPAMPRTAPTRRPAVMRGSREAMTTDESPASARPVNAFQTSGALTEAVPCVMSTTARTATRRTSAAVTAAAPVRDATVDGRVAGWSR